jgi:ABC-type polar amino acid transport system ATPase subunit
MMSEAIIRTKGIKRAFDTPAGRFWALKGIDIEIPEGKFVILRGRSGSGKTTLMNIINSLDDPTEGDVYIEGTNLKDLSERDRENLRRTRMGFVFQSVSLIPSLNAFQNVEFSMRMAGQKINKESGQRVEDCLKLVGLGNRMNHMSAEMSGGEQQRVAIARALAMEPDILCFDEPTSALDPELTGEVLRVIRELASRHTTMIIVTHEMAFARDVADIAIFMDDGIILEKGSAKELINNPKEERTKQFLSSLSSR